MTGTTRRPRRDRLASIPTTLVMIGPPLFLTLFAARAFNPVDVTLVAIAGALAVVTAALVLRRRWAGIAYLVFPVALFTSPAIRELSFNLTAVEAGLWRWWAIGALFSLGVATAAALAVASGSDRSPTGVGSLAAGIALGAVFLVITPIIRNEPAFGRDLSSEELAALSVIDLVNFRYEPALLAIESSGIQRFRLENPSSVPHTVTVDALDIEVWVPAERWAILELDPGKLTEPVAFYCSVGDHRDLGMSGLIEVR